VLPPPIRTDCKSKKENLVFCIQQDDDKQFQHTITRLAQASNWKFIVKTAHPISAPNVISLKYIHDFEELLSKAKVVIVSSKYNYRVSNIMLEAIAHNCVLFALDGCFTKSLAEKFNSLVRVHETWDSVIDLEEQILSDCCNDFENIHGEAAFRSTVQDIFK